MTDDAPQEIPYASSDATRAGPESKAALFFQSLVGVSLVLFGLTSLVPAFFFLVVEGRSSGSAGILIGGAIFAVIGAVLAALGVMKLVYMLRYRGLIRAHDERGETFAEKMIRRW
jgi:hypothetical protein